MRLFTKEQQLFEKLKKTLYRNRGLIDESDESELLSIIDDLQARVPKQYTEQELREAFEDAENRDPVHDEEVERSPNGEYKDRMVEVAWYNYKRCAFRLGALKAEP